jgi:ectoine hydroxylase-related dioxygenase (phytanoyl-CoA dioxygenase family)
VGGLLELDRLDDLRREGWVLVPDLFSAAECDEIVEHIEAAPFRLDLGRAEDGTMAYRPMVHLTDPFLRDVCCDPRWHDIAVPFLGPDVRLYWEQSVAKPPAARTELPWHQDNGYTPLDPEEYLTCWLALDDVDEDNGCLRVIPRSHLDGTRPHHDDRGGNPYFRVGFDGEVDAGVAVPVPRGSVLVFSSLLLHRSGPNPSGRDRRAWIIQFCPGHARSALSGRLLDDRLLVAEHGAWLDEPRRDRELDLLGMLANYQGDATRRTGPGARP